MVRSTVLAISTLVLPATACLSSHARDGRAEVLREVDATRESGGPHARHAAADETLLGTETRLDVVLRLALANNPELAAARSRARAAAERIPATERLPDPEIMYQQEGVALGRPWGLDEAQALMLGVRQSIPAPGSLGAQSRAAVADARVELDNARARVLDLTARVRRAYFEYLRAWSEYGLHLEHVSIASRLVDLARAHYQAGRGSQQDVLRVLVQLSRLHNDLASTEQDLGSARALLNALMARAPDAPLGPPHAAEPSDSAPDVAALDRAIEARRPELSARRHAVAASKARLDAAERTAEWPRFTVGVDYMLMPMMEDPHAYAAMFSMTLPWLNPAHGERARAAESAVAAEEHSLDAARDVARYELRAAAARHEAARRSFAIVDRDVLPQARASYEAAEAAFSVGGGDALGVVDALRAYLEVRLERTRALVRLEESLADLERAAGGDVDEASAREGDGS